MSDDLPGITGPGVAPKQIAEIDAAAIEYRVERDRRMAVTPHEVRTKKNLIDLLHAHEKEIGRDEHGVLRYQHEDLVIELRPGEEKLKVKSVDNGEGDDE